jgi:hypothetical protein
MFFRENDMRLVKTKTAGREAPAAINIRRDNPCDCPFDSYSTDKGKPYPNHSPSGGALNTKEYVIMAFICTCLLSEIR